MKKKFFIGFKDDGGGGFDAALINHDFRSLRFKFLTTKCSSTIGLFKLFLKEPVDIFLKRERKSPPYNLTKLFYYEDGGFMRLILITERVQ